MTRHRMRLTLAGALLTLTLFLLAGKDGLAGGPFALIWWTIDGGGGTSAGGLHTVEGVIGQPDTGSMAGEQYSLNGGYWDAPGATQGTHHMTYLPVTFRGQNAGSQPEASSLER